MTDRKILTPDARHPITIEKCPSTVIVGRDRCTSAGSGAR